MENYPNGLSVDDMQAIRADAASGWQGFMDKIISDTGYENIGHGVGLDKSSGNLSFMFMWRSKEILETDLEAGFWKRLRTHRVLEKELKALNLSEVVTVTYSGKTYEIPVEHRVSTPAVLL